ncbi:MAG TPA: 3-methyl-2-oxobutanoate hydroxymethyltransferase [Chloroflexota bacterium]|nr:3-methyl-2-oxobutanoate hydroxymethyltransferase [Chloroflexota bacterium]
MDKKKLTIRELQEMKRQGHKIRMITAYDYPMANLVDQSPMEMILVGDSLGMVVLGYESTVPVTMEEMIHHTKAVMRGAHNTFVVADLPFMSYQVSVPEAIRNAGRLVKDGGADAVKLEGGESVLPAVRGIVAAGIPVMGHLGLTPQTATMLGGLKSQARDAEAARVLLRDAKLLEEAGVFSLVLEAIPAQLGELVTKELSIPTVGIGAGPGCDGQVLVIHDLLGLFQRFLPKFVKRYANLGESVATALEQYCQEVESATFPAAEHCFNMKREELAKLLEG